MDVDNVRTVMAPRRTPEIHAPGDERPRHLSALRARRVPLRPRRAVMRRAYGVGDSGTIGITSTGTVGLASSSSR